MNDSPDPSGVSPEDVTSPCISVCAVDKTLGMCIGCLRTLKEIGAWRTMTLAEKKATVEACAQRALTMPRRGKDWRPLPAT
ncbi:MAG: DUF1289 domain-containing protein [Rhodospirillaceae bacterium]|nr:DUF1289 domain-containing protein [Rhodospirillaceae bacterium]